MMLRLSQTQDQQAIAKFISAIYTEFNLKKQAALFNWPPEKIALLFVGYKFVLLLGDAGEILSLICFHELGADHEMIALGVSPSFQGRGHMRKLFNYFVENVCSTGSKVFLEVHEKNHRAIAFYEKVGFKTDGLRKNYYSDGASALNMSLDIHRY